jgi:TnpA family transposase
LGFHWLLEPLALQAKAHLNENISYWLLEWLARAKQLINATWLQRAFRTVSNYIDNEYYRRRIQIQLNRGEGRHGIARHVFHGQRGELRQQYRQGQEDQLGALGLVVNTIVLWNT